jgi:hypothetical protein
VILLQHRINRTPQSDPAPGNKHPVAQGRTWSELLVVPLLDLVAAAVNHVAATDEEPDEAPAFQFDLVFCHL